MKQIFVAVITLLSLNSFAQTQTKLPIQCTAALKESGSTPQQQKMEINKSLSDKYFTRLQAKIKNVSFTVSLATDSRLNNADRVIINEMSEQGYSLQTLNMEHIKVNQRTKIAFYGHSGSAVIQCRSTK